MKVFKKLSGGQPSEPAIPADNVDALKKLKDKGGLDLRAFYGEVRPIHAPAAAEESARASDGQRRVEGAAAGARLGSAILWQA